MVSISFGCVCVCVFEVLSSSVLSHVVFVCRFIRVEELKEKLLENNRQTYWVPDFVKVRYLPATNGDSFLLMITSLMISE